MADFATLDLAAVPSQAPYARVRERPGVSTDRTNGPFRRRQTAESCSRSSGVAETRRWERQLRLKTPQFARLASLVDQAAGGALTFAWTPPEGGPVVSVRVLGPLVGMRSSPGLVRCTLTLEEAR